MSGERDRYARYMIASCIIAAVLIPMVVILEHWLIAALAGGGGLALVGAYSFKFKCKRCGGYLLQYDSGNGNMVWGRIFYPDVCPHCRAETADF